MRKIKSIVFGRLWLAALLAAGISGGEARASIANVIGPEGSENSCSNCHAQEIRAWQQTTHFGTYAQRHTTEEAKAILAKMELRSMKRSDVCHHCHYTSILVADKPRAQWGVSCESCHGPGKEWNDIHNKKGGTGATLKWGEGRNESPEERKARLAAAEAKGMIHSEMIYEIAKNCFGCHTVPNEMLVNKGGHKAGSDFDLVAWSQGQIRHNFLSSAGAPDNPTNRPASQEEKRVRYVVGAMVDLEVSLRNLANVKEKGGRFHQAMIERVNRTRKKVDDILKAAAIPGLAAAVKEVPASVTEATTVSADLPGKLGKATKQFVQSAPDLAAIDGQVPTEAKGTALK